MVSCVDETVAELEASPGAALKRREMPS